jgi:uncharacterized protein YqjF (DUF2071 family)
MMIQTSNPDWTGLARNQEQPDERPVMLQNWHDLIFLHSRVPAEVLQAMVPAELTIESFDGSAWLGFVPFYMSQIRSPMTPAAPWLSSFYETNIRTYVTHPKFGPGVWFFSLDAARYLACWYARQFFKLPYFHAAQTGKVEGDNWHYRGFRKERQSLPAVAGSAAELKNYAISVERTGQWHEAEPNTFEFWLVERYRLYSQGAGGNLYTSLVHHKPYQIAEASVKEARITGLDAQFGELDFSSVLVAKTLNVECFSPHQI